MFAHGKKGIKIVSALPEVLEDHLNGATTITKARKLVTVANTLCKTRQIQTPYSA
jgi:hypothetical protein